MTSCPMKLSLALAALLSVLTTTSFCADDAITVFRSGDELIVNIAGLEGLQRTHPELKANLRLKQDGKEVPMTIDLADPAVRGALVLDMAEFGRCDGISATIVSESGKEIASLTSGPIPERPVPGMKSGLSASFAYIEPGTAMRDALNAPKIALPDLDQLRTINLDAPSRLVSKQQIKFPVVTDIDYPLIGGVVVGRQTAAPRDTNKASLYFSAKKAIYDGAKLERWQKFLVEVPVQEAWGAGEGDESLTLKPDEFEVHITNEEAPSGRNMLNDAESDLGQLGEFDTDEQGRIYWRIDGGGAAYVVRFNPHTKNFEQPPIRMDFQKFVPGDVGMLNDGLCKVTCTRGRVYFTMPWDTLSTGDPGNAHRRRLGGVFSISQDWSDRAGFEADIRLHVGSWETARPTFYGTPPKPDVVERKLGRVSVTEAGLFITKAEAKYQGGPWRLDLDEQGNTTFFGVVDSLEDTEAEDGSGLAPTKLVTVKGIPQGRELNVGPGAGRSLVKFNTGEVVMPRSSVRLLTQGLDGIQLIKISKHVSTYEGAPQGTITLRYDLIEKLRAHPDAKGPLADSLNSGLSMGPAFLLSPIPGEPNRAVAVCEYAGYPLAVLDFSHLKDRGTVTKTSLPPDVPGRVGLGPYNSTWVRDGDEQWLYVTGYTGMSRILYSRGGKVLPKITGDVFNSRIAQHAVDGHTRTSMKKIDGLLHVFDGRLLDSGYGLGGRGGDAYSTGVEMFDPSQLSTGRATSQTSAQMSRCFVLRTLRGRMVWNARDGTKHQEVFAASGSVRQQMINELKDPSIGPTNLDAKIFLYDINETGLRDLFGFSLPSEGGGHATEGHIVMSPCNRFVVIMTQDGVLFSYSIAQKQFVDAVAPRGPSGAPIQLIEFKRPSEVIFTSPDGQIFFLAEDPSSLNFNRVIVGDDGRLSVEPHLGIEFDAKEGCQDFKGVVRCFMPDANNDGSYDYVLGYAQKSVEPFVRVITDLIAPSR
jgi:hypothetical protein